MFGDIFRCTKCQFEFATGWNHHNLGASCLCAGCGKRFVITGREEYGPGEQERCELVGREGRTGVFVTSLETVTMSAHGAPLSDFDFSGVQCPACGTAEQ